MKLLIKFKGVALESSDINKGDMAKILDKHAKDIRSQVNV